MQNLFSDGWLVCGCGFSIYTFTHPTENGMKRKIFDAKRNLWLMHFATKNEKRPSGKEQHDECWLLFTIDILNNCIWHSAKSYREWHTIASEKELLRNRRITIAIGFSDIRNGATKRIHSMIHMGTIEFIYSPISQWSAHFNMHAIHVYWPTEHSHTIFQWRFRRHTMNQMYISNLLCNTHVIRRIISKAYKLKWIFKHKSKSHTNKIQLFKWIFFASIKVLLSAQCRDLFLFSVILDIYLISFISVNDKINFVWLFSLHRLFFSLCNTLDLKPMNILEFSFGYCWHLKFNLPM